MSRPKIGLPVSWQARWAATAAKIGLQWDAALAPDLDLAALSRLSCPTLLLRGTHTTLAASAVVDVLHRALPDGRLVEIDGAGHMCAVTHADEVNAHVAGHLRRHGRS